MAQRILEMHRILKPTGSLYLHCDQTASHYLKIVLDRIFGKESFLNEIIWSYQTGGVSKKWFGRKHDILFLYSKTKKYFINLGAVKEERTQEVLRRIDSGCQSATRAANRHRLPFDVWSIQALNAMAKERTGFPTQKPLALLHRIIKASSNAGDVVFDPFCGCATTLVAAQQLGRKWIGIDIEEKARDLVVDRLADDAGMFKDFIHRKDVPVRTDIQNIDLTLSKNKKEIKEKLYREQFKKCNGCNKEMDIRQFHIDHILPRAKDGQDNIENLQLLCGHCNSTKGDRTMEYLRVKIRKMEETYTQTSF